MIRWEPSCDINPLIGCGKFLNSPVNARYFFGVSNAVFGLAFAGITALGLVLVSGADSGGGYGPRSTWRWWERRYGSSGSSGPVHCGNATVPLLPLTWTATIPLIINVLARSAQAGHALPGGLRRILVRGRWYIVAAA